VRRRRFLALAGGAVLCPGRARAAKTVRLGVLTPGETQWQRDQVLAALAAAGYVEGRNLVLDTRSADGRLERLDGLAAALVAARPDAILAVNSPGLRAAMKATATIPIVMGVVGDPVRLGFVASMARPGGNATGISNMSSDLVTRRLQLLKEAVPAARRVALLLHPDEPIATIEQEMLAPAARVLGLELRAFPVREQGELAQAFATALAWRADAALRLAGQAGALARPTIALAAQHRLPVMHLQRSHVAEGGLMAYFSDEADLWRRAGAYLARVLDGEKPGDLPIVQPERFAFVVNLATAKALGLAIPDALLNLADEVIE
jgi:putative ABC transport system substrate-binding protein